MKELELLLVILFSLRVPCVDKSLVFRRDWFGVTVNLLPHLEFLIYAKPNSFLVTSTNAYGIIFYQVGLLPWLTFFVFFFFLSDGVVFGC